MTENLQAVFTLNDNAFARGTDRIMGMLNRIEQRSIALGNQLQNSFESPLGSITKFGVGLISVDKALDLLKQGLGVVSDFQRLDSSLSAVSSSSLDFARTQAYLQGLADKLGLSYETLASSYKGLKAATKDTVLEGQATEKIFTAVVHAGAALKLSNDDIKGSLLALSQMLSKGTVSMEEMRQQLGERLPGAFALAAKAMGVTQSELNKMIASGEVMATDLLPKLADQLEKTYGAQAASNVNTMAGGFTRATDQLKLFIAEFAKTANIDSFFGKLANGIADTIKGFRKSQNGNLKSEVDDFNGLSSDDRKKRMLDLGSQIVQARIDLKDIGGAAPTDKNLAKEANLEKRLAYMTKLYGQMYMITRDGEAQIEKAKRLAANKPIDPIEVLEKAKARFKTLTDKKAGLSFLNQNLSGSEAAELAKLKSQLESAGVRKAPQDTQKAFSVLDHLESTKKLIESDLQGQRALKGFVSPETIHELDTVIIQIKRLKGEAEKPATLKIRGEGLLKENLASEGERHNRLKSPLFDRLNEPNRYGSLDFYSQELDKIIAKASKVSLKNFAISSEQIDSIKHYAEQIGKAQYALERLNALATKQANVGKGKAIADEIQNQAPNEKWSSGAGISQNWTDTALENLAKNKEQVILSAQDMANALQSTLRQGAVGAASAMGALVYGLLEGTKGIEDLPGAVLGAVGDMLQSLATTLAESAAALLLVPGMQLTAAGQFAGSVGLFAAAEAAHAAAKPKRRAMAKGGTLSGPTEITAGEYPGASRQGRQEWVSPVDVGARLIAENMAKMGIGGGMGGRVVFVQHGNELRGVLEHEARSRESLG